MFEDPGDFDRFTRTTERVLHVVLAVAAACTLISGIVFMFVIGGGRDHLAGRVTVAVAAVFLLGAIDTSATRLVNRRRPLLGPDPPAYRRFVLWAALGLATTAALLFGLALFLP